MHQRVEKLKIGKFEELKELSHTVDELRQNLNLYDVVICSHEKDAVLSIACGCFVITSLHNETMQNIIKNKVNGNIFDPAEEEEVRAYCVNQIQNIRNNAFSNAKDMMNRYSFLSVAKLINEFYIQKFKIIKRKQKLAKFFDFQKDKNKTTIKFLGIRIRFKN